MFNRNSLLYGLLIGLLIPVVVSAGLFLFFKGLDLLNIGSTIGFRPLFRERTITLIGIVANAFIVNRFNKKRFTESMRGISIATVVYVVIWLVVFGKTVI
ncbi:MAG: hypothetical protein IPL49_17475 [Saprospirales bacterium]|nr:hypothetical protein [Saprospirales bacterium]MBK8492626.1 hypothetical protein [Saprospirales bacterium]